MNKIDAAEQPVHKPICMEDVKQEARETPVPQEQLGN